MNFDFHVHSAYSRDSALDIKKIIKVAEKRGLSGVALTDHETIIGALKAKSIARDNFVVIIGSEIKTDKGEIIGLFLNEEIKSREFTGVCDEIKDQGGIIVLPHPYRNNKLNPKELVHNVDIVEILNGRTSKELNYRAQILAKEFDLPFIAGSDAHTSLEIGRVQTIFEEPIFDIEDIRRQLLNGEIKVSGRESPYYVRMLSVGIGRYKKDGTYGLMKAGLHKIIR